MEHCSSIYKSVSIPRHLRLYTYMDLSKYSPSFSESVEKHGLKLERTPLEIVQVNVGKLCNQACLHCHVEAGPKRTELMDERTIDRIIELISEAPTVHTVDITGGAPEMCPHFTKLASSARELGKEVIDRCNLTIFFEEGFEDLPEYLAREGITIIASLPCYTEDNVDSQRGSGTFQKSIKALQWLNELGYAQENSKLKLHLVYNPLGASLPPDQKQLELDYKKHLQEEFDIVFNELFTITNMPIKRFLHQLKQWGKLEEYMQTLINNF